MAEKKSAPAPSFRDHIPEDVAEHARLARGEMRKSFESLLPPEFVAHRRAARKEMLLAARGLIDHALEKLEARR
ncbi:MAG: hypothetical protein OEV06_02330 [Anaerolineae bacterium]|nr:hypothetical protein [Anaerolineae bacterium]